MSERTITDADVQAIVDKFYAAHSCRFPNIDPEDMTFAKDLIAIYKETRSEVIKWIIRGIVYGGIICISIVAYFKLKGLK